MFYNLDGIITTEEPMDRFWIRYLADNFIFKENDKTEVLVNTCSEMRRKFACKIFGSLQAYYNLLPSISPALQMGGIDAEVNISKKDFEEFINSLNNNELINKILYFYDCANIIETLQNSILETSYLFGSFYKVLNENSFLINDRLIIEDDYQYASGPIVTNITSVVNHLFINLYSQLDFVTKIVYEYENMHTNFLNYPRLKCDKVLYGNGNKTKLKNLKNSIYEKSENLMKVIILRNEIVHNASIDNLPKVYYKTKKKSRRREIYFNA